MIVLGWMNCCGVKIGTKMSKQLIVIVDADAIIAQTDPKDLHHQKANEISQKLVSLNAQVIYPVTAVTEANAYMQRVLNSTSSAYATVQLMASPETNVIEINKQTLINALDYFSPKTSKNNTLFDCIIAALAKEYKADAIFSFDKFYKTKGFKLASEL